MGQPYLLKMGAAQVIRRCVPQWDYNAILTLCHNEGFGGHFGAKRTARKVLDCGFSWPTLIKDAFEFCKACDR